MCSPAEFVTFDQKNHRLEMRLNKHLLNIVQPDEPCSYPTPCKSRYRNTLTDQVYFPMQFPYPLDILPILPQMIEAGVDALKIEGRQRSRTYIKKVGRIYRQAIDLYQQDPKAFRIKKTWLDTLSSFFGEEGFTKGCYLEK